MVQIKKKSKKKKAGKLRLEWFSFVLFVSTAVLYVAARLFLGNINNILSTKEQTIKSQIAEIEKTSDSVKIEIQTLSTRDRIDNIADENGLRMNQDNIVTIIQNEE